MNLVSIIIPTFNSEKTLFPVLESIKKQTYRRIETIIIDKGSVDETIGVAKKFDTKVFILKDKERTSAFNLGAKKSKGDYVYYLGSDYVIDENLIEETIKKITKENADAAIIPNFSDPSVSFWAKVRLLEKMTYVNEPLIEAARFFKKGLFFDIGGYDEHMVAYEEHDLHNRLLDRNAKIVRINNVKEIHIGEPKSVWEIAKKYYYYGKTINKYIKKYPEKARRQITPLRPCYFRHRKKFLKHPILALGFIVYQFMRYFSAGSGYLNSRISGTNQ